MNMISQKFSFLLLKLVALLALGFLTACASTTPEYDAKFGDAVRAAVAQQTINPEASQNTDPVNGVDGKAAENAMERYHDSFKKQETESTNNFTFDFGGGGGSSGGVSQ